MLGGVGLEFGDVISARRNYINGFVMRRVTFLRFSFSCSFFLFVLRVLLFLFLSFFLFLFSFFLFFPFYFFRFFVFSSLLSFVCRRLKKRSQLTCFPLPHSVFYSSQIKTSSFMFSLNLAHVAFVARN